MIRKHFETCESTQDEAFDLADQIEAPFFVTADYQISGRGRAQREWHNEPGRSLNLSLLVSLPSQKLQALSLVVGVSLAKLIHDPNLKLKWPNDLMLENKKVGGILVESRVSGGRALVAIGIGINWQKMAEAEYAGLQKKIDEELIAKSVFSAVQIFEVQGFAYYRDAFLDLMWMRDEFVDLVVDGETRRLKQVGVSVSGQLLTEGDGALEAHLNAEISLENKA